MVGERGRLPPEVRRICDEFLAGLRGALGPKLVGVYPYGSVAFPGWKEMPGDIDFHVIVRDPLTAEDRRKIELLHLRLAQEMPPLGGELDGYYLWLEDARKAVPPPNRWREGIVDASWALHRAHILAGRCVRLWGPDPSEIYPPASWAELYAALEGELRCAEAQVERESALGYCVLNLCRILYSFETRDVVVSKQKTAEWALDRIPTEYHPLLRAARRMYAGNADQVDRTALRGETRGLEAFVRSRIAALGSPSEAPRNR